MNKNEIKLGTLCLCKKNDTGFKKGSTYRVCDYEEDHMIWFCPDDPPKYLGYDKKPLPRSGFLIHKKKEFKYGSGPRKNTGVYFRSHFYTPQEVRKMKLENLSKSLKQT